MQRKAYPLLAAAALAAMLGLGGAATTGCGQNNASGGESDETAASVNGKNISVAEIDRLIDQQVKEAGPNAPQLTPVSLTAARMQLLDQLISEEALFQRAQKENVVPSDDELNQKIQEQKQAKGLTEEQFQKFLQTVGQTDQQFRDQAKRQLAIQKLRDKVSAKVPTPSEAEVRKYFDENKAQLVAPRGVELSDIIVDPRDNGARDDARSPEEAQAKANRIAAQLKANVDYATLASTQSEDSNTAMQGGSIGFFSTEQLQQTFGPDIAARFFSMQPGQIAEPLKGGDQRWHIFKLNSKREQQKELTFEEVQQQIAQQITDQRKQLVLSALMIDAVNSASVKNFLAERILEHPDTFGSLRPSPLTEARPTPPVPAKPAAPAGEAQPTAPVNANVNAQAPPPAKAPAANTNAKK